MTTHRVDSIQVTFFELDELSPRHKFTNPDFTMSSYIFNPHVLFYANKQALSIAKSDLLIKEPISSKRKIKDRDCL